MPTPSTATDAAIEPRPTRWTTPRVALAVAVLLGLHVGLAETSLRVENPTVDEVAHLPAGVTYWQKGTFKLYHHNPPLVKLVAAIPVVMANPVTAPLYDLSGWRDESQLTFAEVFAYLNVDRYLALFTSARTLMPIFSAIGGLAVFAWSSRLYGRGAGLVSLALWASCPNVLAHARLVTTDVAAASLAVASTYLFWRLLDRPTWPRAVGVGVVLGLAQLTKFSLVLLYGFWPMIALVRLVGSPRLPGWAGRAASGMLKGLAILALSVLVIDLGYGFEGVGWPLGRFEFASRTLTRPAPPGALRPSSPNKLLEGAWRHRVNRFRGTTLADLPVPLPRHYVAGFDEQKVETEGVPKHYLDDRLPADDSALTGYTVYLDGQLRKGGGWWYYYLATLAYKLPEGTWALLILAALATVASPRARLGPSGEFALLAIPVGVLAATSLLTDICLGLRYVLLILPFGYVAAGRVVPWVSGLSDRRGRIALATLVGLALGANALSVATIHPHYLAYFNRVSGGPDRGSEHLIDSNLDWGQDLVTLARWLKEHHPGRPVGLAYFGQINPSLLLHDGGGLGFEWFLPPALGEPRAMTSDPSRLVGPAPRLTPGLYAVSASVARGLGWRMYDSLSVKYPQLAWSVSWAFEDGAFAYFGEFEPVAKVGHSIFIYELTEADCARWDAAQLERRGGPTR